MGLRLLRELFGVFFLVMLCWVTSCDIRSAAGEPATRSEEYSIKGQFVHVG